MCSLAFVCSLWPHLSLEGGTFSPSTQTMPSVTPGLISKKLDAYLRRAVCSIRHGYFIWRRMLAFVSPWFSVSILHQSSSAGTIIQQVSPSDHTVRQQNPGRNVSAGAETDASAHAGSRSIPGQGSGASTSTNVNSSSQASEAEENRDDDNDGNNEDDRDGIAMVEVSDFDIEVADLYIHVILPDGIFGKKQIPIKVTEFTNDYELFKELNRIYRQDRGRWRALFMVSGLRPTAYELFNRNNVRTFFDPSNLAATMPDLLRPPPEYSFTYHPSDPIPNPPLLHEAQLTRLYHSPTSSIHRDENGEEVFDAQCYERSPKRKGRLTYTPNNGFPTGYAYEFIECFDVKFILTCELFIAFLAFLLAGLYWGIAKEDQKTGTAFNIAMFIFVVGQFCYGVILALGERLDAWRFY
ncbi:hypothetical protein EK21DRAFT_91541 [Setomelanomma holmii]|uniref:Uncharacterized protein n=1 Tax=Setomelanomma holmii TaxID=210430 RepID=A0A9P4H3K7_9PLEO|nr:hypothetical protein EK21DRAFT_91541 [Setomelanomma holmii]